MRCCSAAPRRVARPCGASGGGRRACSSRGRFGELEPNFRLAWRWQTLSTNVGPGFTAGLCLLMPVLLLGVHSPRRWRRRALLLAASMAVLFGWEGMAPLLRGVVRAFAAQNTTLVEAFAVAIGKPAPIIGLWPLAGWLAALQLFVSIAWPRPRLIFVAALIGMAFLLAANLLMFRWSEIPRSDGRGLFLYLVLAIEMVCLMLATALPLTLLMWDSRRIR